MRICGMSVSSLQFPVIPGDFGYLKLERFVTGNWRLATSLVASLRRLHVFERQMLLVERLRPPHALKLPRRHVREMLIVAARFAVRCLAFLAEVAAARFGAMQR